MNYNKLAAKVALRVLVGGAGRRVRDQRYLERESPYLSDDGSQAPLRAEQGDLTAPGIPSGYDGCIPDAKLMGDGSELEFGPKGDGTTSPFQGYDKPTCRRPSPVRPFSSAGRRGRRLAFEMTLTEWKVYRKQHPGAKKENHTITESEGGSAKPEEEGGEKKPKVEEHGIGEYKHKLKLTKDELKETLSKGHYTIISAGRNPADPKEEGMKPTDEFFAKRQQELQDELEQIGIPYTPMVGHYKGKEQSFLVFHDEGEEPKLPETKQTGFMTHYGEDHAEDARDVMNKLGRKYNQDSVLHGAGGKNRLRFTSGKNEGKECGGEGWQETPEAEDFFTDIETKDREHTKFSLDIHGCFDDGYL